MLISIHDNDTLLRINACKLIDNNTSVNLIYAHVLRLCHVGMVMPFKVAYTFSSLTYMVK